jgi:hypothetical protein
MCKAFTFAAIFVGDAPSILEKLNLESLARQGRGAIKMVKFRLANGNELSVTYNCRENRIIYVEDDWPFRPEGATTDIPPFKFGSQPWTIYVG